MTGYGRAVRAEERKKVTVEMHSVNSKSADVSIHLPGYLRSLEPEIRRTVVSRCLRGKIDLYIGIEELERQPKLSIDEGIAATYWSRLQQLSSDSGIPLPQDPMPMILGLQGVLCSVEVGEEEAAGDGRMAFEALDEAIDRFCEFREQEGRSLYNVFSDNLRAIRTLIDSTAPYEQERIDTVRERLETELKKLTEGYDPTRLEQEMIFYIDKLDVHEEKNRLINHLDYFATTMDGPIGQGRKLGFIAQEIGREINTFGSKSNHATLQRITVKMKDHLEQIKEQVLNVL